MICTLDSDIHPNKCVSGFVISGSSPTLKHHALKALPNLISPSFVSSRNHYQRAYVYLLVIHLYVLSLKDESSSLFLLLLWKQICFWRRESKREEVEARESEIELKTKVKAGD